MEYVSTRGSAPALDFAGVTLAGLASDGGLYVPREWPRFSESEIAAMAGLPYAELAARVMQPFVADSLTSDRLLELCRAAYGRFAHKAVTPLKQLDEQQWLLELFHGPTLAFKDVALQLLGLLFEEFLGRTGQNLTIVGATSGDTGSAALGRVVGARRTSVTSTIGVRGLEEEDLKQATFDAGQMRLLDQYATSKEAAEQGARAAGLAPARVEYLGGKP